MSRLKNVSMIASDSHTADEARSKQNKMSSLIYFFIILFYTSEDIFSPFLYVSDILINTQGEGDSFIHISLSHFIASRQLGVVL